MNYTKKFKKAIRLNRFFWPRSLLRVFSHSDDPRKLLNKNINPSEFIKSVSALKFDKTWKTTQRKRFPTMVNLLKSIKYSKNPIILDVGASTGSASLDIIFNIPYKKYFLTDLNPEVFVQSKGLNTYFFDVYGNCFMVANNFFIFYPQYINVILKIDKNHDSMIKINLLDPILLKSSKRVQTKKYNMLKPWKYEKVDLIIIGNLLNRSLFSRDNIFLALRNLMNALNPGGRLAIVENRAKEKGSLFQLKNDKLSLESDYNGGTEIKELIDNLI